LVDLDLNGTYQRLGIKHNLIWITIWLVYWRLINYRKLAAMCSTSYATIISTIPTLITIIPLFQFVIIQNLLSQQGFHKPSLLETPKMHLKLGSLTSARIVVEIGAQKTKKHWHIQLETTSYYRSHLISYRNPFSLTESKTAHAC
jgi:hypothetical protein